MPKRKKPKYTRAIKHSNEFMQPMTSHVREQLNKTGTLQELVQKLETDRAFLVALIQALSFANPVPDHLMESYFSILREDAKRRLA